MKLTLLLLLGIIVLAVLFLAAGLKFLMKLVVRWAPEEIQEIMLKHPDQPVWMTVIGVILECCIAAAIIFILYYAGYDAVMRHMTFLQVFIRYLIILEGYKLFDMICLDWLALIKFRIFEKLYPETKGSSAYDSFGFNLKSQIMKLIGFAVLSAVIAYFITR